MKAYYREKIRLLAEFGIPITERIENHLKSCTNEI